MGRRVVSVGGDRRRMSEEGRFAGRRGEDRRERGLIFLSKMAAEPVVCE